MNQAHTEHPIIPSASQLLQPLLLTRLRAGQREQMGVTVRRKSSGLRRVDRRDYRVRSSRRRSSAWAEQIGRYGRLRYRHMGDSHWLHEGDVLRTVR